MTISPTDKYFVEIVENVSFANGVLRITLGAQDNENSSTSVVQLLVPANQVSNILQSIANASQTIQERLAKSKEQSAPKEKAKSSSKRASSGPAKKA